MMWCCTFIFSRSAFLVSYSIITQTTSTLIDLILTDNKHLKLSGTIDYHYSQNLSLLIIRNHKKTNALIVMSKYLSLWIYGRFSRTCDGSVFAICILIKWIDLIGEVRKKYCACLKKNKRSYEASSRWILCNHSNAMFDHPQSNLMELFILNLIWIKYIFLVTSSNIKEY